MNVIKNVTILIALVCLTNISHGSQHNPNQYSQTPPNHYNVQTFCEQTSNNPTPQFPNQINQTPKLLDLFIPATLVNDGKIPPLHVESNNTDAGNKEQQSYLAIALHTTLKMCDPDYLINHYTSENHIIHTEIILKEIQDQQNWGKKLANEKTVMQHWLEIIKARSWIEPTIAKLLTNTEHHNDTGIATIKLESVIKLRRLIAANRHILSPDILLASRLSIQNYINRNGEKAFFPESLAQRLYKNQITTNNTINNHQQNSSSSSQSSHHFSQQQPQPLSPSGYYPNPNTSPYRSSAPIPISPTTPHRSQNHMQLPQHMPTPPSYQPTPWPNNTYTTENRYPQSATPYNPYMQIQNTNYPTSRSSNDELQHNNQNTQQGNLPTTTVSTPINYQKSSQLSDSIISEYDASNNRENSTTSDEHAQQLSNIEKMALNDNG